MDLVDLRDSCTIPLGDAAVQARRKGERTWHSIRERIGFFPERNRRFRQQRYPYLAGLTDLDEIAPKPLFSRGWHFDFRQSLHALDSFEKYRAHNAQSVYTHSPALINLPKGFAATTPEVLIFAPNQIVAQDVLELTDACLLLSTGYSSRPLEDLFVQADRLCSFDVPFQGQSGGGTTSVAGVYLACTIANAVWSNQQLRQAIARLLHSTKIAYSHWMEFDPAYGSTANFRRTPFSFTAYALAITAAYSVVEELGVEPKARKGLHVWSSSGWDPSIRGDVERRLTLMNIDPNEEVFWLKRDGASGVKEHIAKIGGKPARWAKGRVRDKIIPLAEAILICHRIRVKIAAHNTKTETKSLSSIDLQNVQQTCRRLLLAASGMHPAKLSSFEPSELEFRAAN